MIVNGESIKPAKQRGEWAELHFMARAFEYGLGVSKPWGESARYDFIVDCQGKFLRVQVKSTTCQKRKSYVYHVNGRPYTSDEIDFLAIYIIPKDIWFIFPVAAVSIHARNIVLSPLPGPSKHAIYKEAWHLLCGNEASSANTLNAHPAFDGIGGHSCEPALSEAKG